MAENNISLAFSNHQSWMLPKLFPETKIAQKYSAAASKTTCIINGAIAPHFLRETMNIMKCSPYSLLTDGSKDTGLEKMNPLTVKIFDVNTGRVESQFLDMCTTEGTDSAMAASIFQNQNKKSGLYFASLENFMKGTRFTHANWWCVIISWHFMEQTCGIRCGQY